MTLPSWWDHGVRVVGHDGQTGTVRAAGRGGWIIQLDSTVGDESYVVEPEPDKWRPEVRQLLSPGQLHRVIHDSQRALLRAFGCHYVPEYEALPETARTAGLPVPRAVNRPELDGLQAIIRGAVLEALAPYTSGI